MNFLCNKLLTTQNDSHYMHNNNVEPTDWMSLKKLEIKFYSRYTYTAAYTTLPRAAC